MPLMSSIEALNLRDSHKRTCDMSNTCLSKRDRRTRAVTLMSVGRSWKGPLLLVVTMTRRQLWVWVWVTTGDEGRRYSQPPRDLDAKQQANE